MPPYAASEAGAIPDCGLGLHYPEVYVSGPANLSLQISELEALGSINGKTILITGGASGIGEATARKLARLGANVVVGDINVKKAKEVVDRIRRDAGVDTVAASFECDVTNYESQGKFFLEAIRWSPYGAIDGVIVNAGVAELGVLFEEMEMVPGQYPPEPNLATFNVNLKGAIYTIRLAHHFLRHNSHPEVKEPFAQASRPWPNDSRRSDRFIIVLGSYSSFFPSPILPLYSLSKHGLLGLFSSVRVTSQPHHRIRFNLVCPYFVRTPLMPNSVQLLLSGQQMVDMAHLTDQIVRCVGDSRIAGRMLAVGPNGFVEDVDIDGGLDEVESFSRRVVKVLNRQYQGRGWWEKWGRTVRDALILILGWIGLWILARFKMTIW